MRTDPVTQSRRATGDFQRRANGRAPASHQARQHAAWGRQAPPLRLHSVANGAVALLLLGALSPAAAARARPVPGTSPTVAVAACGAPLADAHADLGPPLPGGGLHDRFAGLANLAAGACVAHPRRCGAALGTAAGAGLVTAAARWWPTWTAAAPPASNAPVGEAQDRLVAALRQVALPAAASQRSPALDDALVAIARACGPDRHCRASAIAELLGRLPAQTLRRLAAVSAAPAAGPAGTWPPAAQAAPLALPSLLQALAETLAALYTPDVAAYQDDLEQIVQATRTAATGAAPTPFSRWLAANAARMDAVERCLRRDGRASHAQPYPVALADDTGTPHRLHARNLRIAIAGDPSAGARRRLLLVAHADMIGLGQGSEGAYDNASGVAALLHVARVLRGADVAADTAVELLITSNEELGLLGSAAALAECRRQGDCPTLVVNVDLVGRGGHHYLLGTGAPRAQADGVAQARALLAEVFAAQGFDAPLDIAPARFTSDNLVFEDAGIATLSVAQLSPDDAAQWRRIAAAKAHWQQADRAMDWARWEDQAAGRIVLDPAELAGLQHRYRQADAAWHAYQALRDAFPRSAPVLIHGEGDRLHRVDPRMAVSFADALARFVARWAGA